MCTFLPVQIFKIPPIESFRCNSLIGCFKDRKLHTVTILFECLTHLPPWSDRISQLSIQCFKANEEQISIFITERLSKIINHLARHRTLMLAIMKRVKHGKNLNKIKVMIFFMQTDSTTSRLTSRHRLSIPCKRSMLRNATPTHDWPSSTRL